MSQPPQALLFEIYRQMPFLVIHVTTDGIVLHCNPETLRITGYAEGEFVGKNLWATLFPGKLFAQVPKFISLLQPAPLLKDVPMTIRTKAGAERIIAFSRYVHMDLSRASEGDVTPRSFICIGVDLTDRLLDADRAQLPPAETTGPGLMPFGPHIGNAGAIDSELVTPIAISPRPPGTTGPCPIEQVREGLARVETHIHCVVGAFDQAELDSLGQFAAALTGGLNREKKVAYQVLALEEEKHLRGCARTLGSIKARVDELLALHRPDL